MRTALDRRAQLQNSSVLRLKIKPPRRLAPCAAEKLDGTMESIELQPRGVKPRFRKLPPKSGPSEPVSDKHIGLGLRSRSRREREARSAGNGRPHRQRLAVLSFGRTHRLEMRSLHSSHERDSPRASRPQSDRRRHHRRQRKFYDRLPIRLENASKSAPFSLKRVRNAARKGCQKQHERVRPSVRRVRNPAPIRSASLLNHQNRRNHH